MAKQKVGKKSKTDATFKSGKIEGFNGTSYSIRWDKARKTEKYDPDQTAFAVRVASTIGARIEKEFPKIGLFQGKVVDIIIEDDEIYYFILYDDGDEEELDAAEFDQCHAAYLTRNEVTEPTPAMELEEAEEKKDDPTIVSTSSSSPRVGRKRERRSIKYTEDSDDISEESPPKSKRKAAKKRKVTKDDDDEDFEAFEDSDDESLPDDMVIDESEEEFIEETPPRKKASRKNETNSKKKSAKNTKKDLVVPKKEGWPKDPHFYEKLEKDRKSFKPNNNPQKWPKNGTYVEPCGLDPTHGIVEDIIMEQVRKVGNLLQMVTDQNKTKGIPGELGYPIKLMTACSGTDAPSIALGLVQECYAKAQSSHKFDYSHEMSCEIEPFKQAYIGRNFPGVPLFPDINKLTDPDVKDVYGRSQEIPDGNLFVAGTSCKDFSMLKTTYRKDIEDKGTSGQTFLSAVEFLETKQPKVAIFENVDGAPWSKMQEYITGRFELVNRNDCKKIVGAKSGENSCRYFLIGIYLWSWLNHCFVCCRCQQSA